jgi:hypothetical protein
LMTGLCCWAGLAGATDRLLAFDVYLDDDPVGMHQVRITDQGDRKCVQVDSRIDVDFLAFNLYRYRHQATEIWHRDCLYAIDSHTDDNGDEQRVSGSANGRTLTVETPQGTTSFDGCLRSFAYWSPALLASERLLNPQTGNQQATELIETAEGPLSFADRRIGSVHYRLQVADTADLDLWYDAAGDWQALQTRVSGNRILTYVRRETAQ